MALKKRAYAFPNFQSIDTRQGELLWPELQWESSSQSPLLNEDSRAAILVPDVDWCRRLFGIHIRYGYLHLLATVVVPVPQATN